jgi:PPOX class probable F420-dependent enzyme
MTSGSGTDGGVAWVDIARRLASRRNYWLVTVDADGGPHAVPVWGTVHSGSLYCFSTRTTRKSRNLARDSRAVVHLEDGDDVVIVHGRMEDVGDPAETPEVVRALAAKYDHPEDAGYLPSLEPGDGPDYRPDVLYRLEPERALLWSLSDFDASQVEWRRDR